MFGQVGQTVTVVNKSGKIVSTSKHLVNVFKEAKAAYQERKAEIHSSRRQDYDEQQARHRLRHLNLEEQDNHSRASSRRSSASHAAPRRSKTTRNPRKPHVERGYTDSFYVNDVTTTNNHERRSPPPEYYSAQGDTLPSPRRVKTTPLPTDNLALAYGEDIQRQELVRRHSENPAALQSRHSRPRSVDSIDMDLAYGDLPPPLPVRRMDDEAELRNKVTRLQQVLDEANCLQHTATTTIQNLQKNPEALAAVGLALAEISNLATKMAPGMLTALKGSFPAVFALLASPQFLIAAGVGVGVTIVMLGGYKIIKQLKDKKEIGGEREMPMLAEGQLHELDTELSHVERWRRGIADVELESVGTTVDGEFITPMASRRLMEEGALRPEDLKSNKSTKSKSRRKSEGQANPSTRRAKSTTSRATSSRSEKGKTEQKDKKKNKDKGPSGLRMMFKGHGSSKD